MAPTKRKKIRWFFKIGTDYFARSEIKSVRQLKTPSPDRDGGPDRTWIVTVTPESVGGDPRYSKIWVTEEQVAPILVALEEEVNG
jgi:hypothetical protein